MIKYEVLVKVPVYRVYQLEAESHADAELRILGKHLANKDPKLETTKEWESEKGFKILSIKETHS